MNSRVVNKYSEFNSSSVNDKNCYQNTSSQIFSGNNKNSTNDNEFNRIYKSENIQTNVNDSNQDDPLFKIIFRDELIARKYRKKIEDVFKHILSVPINDVDETVSSDLILNIYDLQDQVKENIQRNNSDNNVYIKRERHDDSDLPNFKKQRSFNDNQSQNQLSDQDCNQIPNANSYQTNNLETWFESKYIEIESYEDFQEKSVIFLAENGLTFFIPTGDTEKDLKTINVEMNEICKLSVHFGTSNPSLCFYLSKTAINNISQILNSDKSNNPQTDTGFILKKLTVLPEQISDESKSVIKALFKNKIIIETDSMIKDHFPNKVSPTTYETENSEFELKSNVDTDEDESEQIDINYDSVMSNNYFETLFCRIVMVGSYENAKRRKFFIANDYIKFCIPLLNNDSVLVSLTIEMKDIVRIAICFSSASPLLLLYISEKSAAMIRAALNMNDPKGPYIDPKSEDDVLNKIVILPNFITDQSKVIINWFDQGKIELLDEEETKEMFKIFAIKHEKQKLIELEGNMNAIIHSDDAIDILSTWFRIGSYNCDELTFTLFLNGFIFDVPSIDKRRVVNITVETDEVLKVQYQMSKRRCHLLLYLNEQSTERIGMALGMLSSNEGPCINVKSHRTEEKVLTISFRLFGEKARYILRTLLSKIQLKEKVTTGQAKSIIKSQV